VQRRPAAGTDLHQAIPGACRAVPSTATAARQILSLARTLPRHWRKPATYIGGGSRGGTTRWHAERRSPSVRPSGCKHPDVLTVAFTNQKGGVGKTSTVIGLASALDRKGLRVLCVDLDPQADLTSWLGLDPFSPEMNVNDVIHADERGGAKVAVKQAGWGRQLYCISATLDLAERESDTSTGSEFRLKKALDGVSDFDLVLIDCPPSVGRLVVLGLVAASHLVIVTEPSVGSLRGVQNVTQTLEVVKEHYNPAIALGGIIVNHEGRTNESALRVAEVVEAYGAEVWQPYIPARAVVASAMGARAPVADFGASGSGVDEIYAALAGRLLALTSMDA